MTTENLSIEKIVELQKKYNVTSTQEGINSGQCWHMEGSTGRFAMNCLKSGICFLPEEPHRDAYGNTVPSRNMIKDGTQGSLGLAQEFWQSIEDDDDDKVESLHEMFGDDDLF